MFADDEGKGFVMKIDAHQHFWTYTPDEYKWIRTDDLKHDFMPDDLAPLLAEVGFDGTVAVQARSMAKETTWLLELANRYEFITGVVGWLDVTDDDLGKTLERFSEHPVFCGVRCGIKTDPDDPGRPSAAFLRGLRTLATFDKTFDVLVRPPKLPLSCLVIEAVPEVRFVLNHIAKPLIAEQVLEPWETDMRRLAAAPNVTCKVSGMVTCADHVAWQADDFRPYLDVVFEAFGPERLLIGSDWPVCTQAASYQQTMGIVLDYIAQLSQKDRNAVLGETAARVYRLT
jgi:L-fuconolactonase